MSIFLKFSSKNSKLVNKNVKFKAKITLCLKFFSSTNLFPNETTLGVSKKFIPFQEKINFRKSEAKKSIIFGVQERYSHKELYSYCSTFGAVKQMFHYTIGKEPKHFILVEFMEEANISSSILRKDSCIIPVNSPWLKPNSKKFVKFKSKNIKLVVENGITPPSDQAVIDKLRKCDNITEQIETLYRMSKLTDLESRLRFLTARQVEMSISGKFSNAEILPFGSSVNGFGKMGCDLDVVLRLNNYMGLNGIDRTLSSQKIAEIGDWLNSHLLGCKKVMKIPHAQVPIVKFSHEFTNVECDLSMSNISAIHMSDFLYIMGCIDPRVRPLVFAVKKWASEVGLTNSSPGPWITNFSLTLLVLFFLQASRRSSPILPSLNTLVKAAESKDCITEEGVNCSFLRDLKKLHFKTTNEETLEELLCGFFEFYSKFDFDSKSVCLNVGVALPKPGYSAQTKSKFSALYIINPLEKSLNVSKNVRLEQIKKFKLKVKEAAWLLQSTDEPNPLNWGLLSIFEKMKKTILPTNFFVAKKRIVEVDQLFEGEENKEIAVYKNEDVKRQVAGIRKDIQVQLKKFKVNKDWDR